MIRILRHSAIVWIFLIATAAIAQTQEQKKLETERTRLQQEIAQIEKLLFSNTEKEKGFEDEIEDLNRKISVREQLIRVTNKQANIINRAIEKEESTVGSLEREIEVLKKDYADMIRRSYVSKSKQNRLMFLLSSQNFFQAYKRIQYLKQFAQYRKKQALEISSKSEELLRKINQLRAQKKQKDLLLSENRKERSTLVREKGNLQNSLSSIRKNKSKYEREIANKTKRSKAIDAQIEKMIKEAIAAANRKKETAKATKTSSGFVMTAETNRVAANFAANKGKLIWPVAKGIVKRGFGVYADPVYPQIKHQNNGVIIATEANAEARSIFKGEVVAILRVPGGGLGVQVRHGNYISTYYNLKSVSVSKGDQVGEKDSLGIISTNPFNGQTQLKFYLYQNTTKLNPQQWIYKL
jgi:septal ring factor EnvC (AmiA/AmiB activator)